MNELEIDRIAVVGAGTIGLTVAQDLAQHQCDVVLVDVVPEALDRAAREIARNVRFYRLYSQSTGDHDVQRVLARIEFTSELSRLADVQFVIENVTEDFEVKKPLYGRLHAVCPGDAVFAANTSCISITQLGSISGRPSQVVGLHFMNPSPLKPSVELIRGAHTSDRTVAAAQAVVAHLGKRAVLVQDAPGFVCNRVMTVAINEAIELVRQGVASAEDIDYLFKTSYGHKMGPLETADFIGLDTILNSIEVLHRDLGEAKFRSSELLREMVAAGLLGRKSGRGFYDYARSDV